MLVLVDIDGFGFKRHVQVVGSQPTVSHRIGVEVDADPHPEPPFSKSPNRTPTVDAPHSEERVEETGGVWGYFPLARVPSLTSSGL